MEKEEIKKAAETVRLALDVGFNGFTVWKKSGTFAGMNCFKQIEVDSLERIYKLLMSSEVENVSILPARKSSPKGHTERTIYIYAKKATYRVSIWYLKKRENR